jgi:hypothetical protein
MSSALRKFQVFSHEKEYASASRNVEASLLECGRSDGKRFTAEHGREGREKCFKQAPIRKQNLLGPGFYRRDRNNE